LGWKDLRIRFCDKDIISLLSKEDDQHFTVFWIFLQHILKFQVPHIWLEFKAKQTKIADITDIVSITVNHELNIVLQV